VKDLELTLEERSKTHGDFEFNSKVSRWIKEIINQNDTELSIAQHEALDCIAAKMARILSGGHNHADNWHDIAGYARLIEKQLTKG
jgi:hypothetical protein